MVLKCIFTLGGEKHKPVTWEAETEVWQIAPVERSYDCREGNGWPLEQKQIPFDSDWLFGAIGWALLSKKRPIYFYGVRKEDSVSVLKEKRCIFFS